MLDQTTQTARQRLSENLRPIALAAALVVPLGLLHAWVLAEIGIAIADILFLAEMARTKNLAWLAKPWIIVALTWWLWLTSCSTPLFFFPTAGWLMSFAEAAVILRLIIFTAALESWLLTTQNAKNIAWLLLAMSVLWIGLECWQEYLTGSNLFGDHRWGDGSLTGPFYKPRAGQLYAHLLFIAVLPPAMAVMAKPGILRRTAGLALIALGVVTSVLIGQRMGTMFTAIGLATAAIFIPTLRKPAFAIAALAVLVLLLTPLISPATHAKLVGETSKNLHHFALSPYGELYTRATVMGLQSPLHGWGYNGFRALCPFPVFDKGLPALGIAPSSVALFACNLHPHNFYLQSFADSGYPGLILFSLMMLTFLLTLGRFLFKNPAPLRVGLFACVVTFVWPLASTDEFPTLYMSGWLFFALGLGLAVTHIPSNAANKDATNV